MASARTVAAVAVVRLDAVVALHRERPGADIEPAPGMDQVALHREAVPVEVEIRCALEVEIASNDLVRAKRLEMDIRPAFKSVEDPKWNIAAGIYYNRTLYRKFENTSQQDKLYMTFASYNAGYGRILNASKRTPSEEKVWDEIKHHLPRETQGYVKRIRRLMGEL